MLELNRLGFFRTASTATNTIERAINASTGGAGNTDHIERDECEGDRVCDCKARDRPKERAQVGDEHEQRRDKKQMIEAEPDVLRAELGVTRGHADRIRLLGNGDLRGVRRDLIKILAAIYA